MTSRRTFGSQQPSQPHAIAGRPHTPARTRSVATGSVNARRPDLTVDSSAKGSQRSSTDARSGSGGSRRASPATSGRESPICSTYSQRDGDRKRKLNGASSLEISAHERLPVGFPLRPGQYMPEAEIRLHDRPGGQPNWPKPEYKAHSFDAPTSARLFAQGKTTDFNPWMGSHVEDSLTEQTVKSGFLNKAIIANETSTARLSLWNHIKGKAGLPNLSQLFVAVVDKRQTLLRLSAPSTFKPPPRVTLTNTKREAWLRDLANPACALRRLNRTIPYGINGKVLLEQCLSKDIPTARAVWLAKCIGANELRTLKRKGVVGLPGISGELKWVREWTVHVEQFVESVISNSGQENWKNKMQYVLRLIHYLFVEQLLDHEHFLDWILSAFESTTVERLPMWLVHIQLYWNSLASSRRRGRRVAECLLKYMEAALTDDNADLLTSVLHRMRVLIAKLATSHAGCLIGPRIWSQHRSLLRSLSLRPEFYAARHALESVFARNERLALSSGNLHVIPSSPRRKVIGILDELSLDISIDRITSQCQEEIGSAMDLMSIILQWATSIYREGSHRIFIAARLLRRCKALGADLEGAVLQFVEDLSGITAVDEKKISRVVAELVRSKQFAVAHLLQSLIATGRFGSTEHDPLSTERLVNFIEDIPTDDLPQHIADLRRILLNSAGRPDYTTSGEVGALQQTISHKLRRMDSGFQLEKTLLDRLRNLRLSEKMAISLWLRQDVLAFWSGNTPLETEDCDNLEQVPTCTTHLQIFIVARNVLECLEDFAMLADVIGICSATQCPEAILSLIDTIHFHYQCFSAIGALQPFLTQVVERYQALRLEVPLERTYLRALADLCATCNVDDGIAQQLRYDLTRCAQQTDLAMCSPASDNAADFLTASAMESDEMIERILSSGTSMDEQSMNRMFKRLTERLEEQIGSYQVEPARCGQWFARLRNFDKATFDGLVRNWLSSSAFTSKPKSYFHVLPALIGSECLTLSTFVSIVDDCLQTMSEVEVDATIGLELCIFEAILISQTPRPAATTFENYKYQLQQRRFALESPRIILKHMRRGFALSNARTASQNKHVRSIMTSESSLAFLRITAAKQSLFGETGNIDIVRSTLGDMFKEILDKLLDPSDSLNLSALPHREQLARLVTIVDDFSLPFCQLQTQYLLAVGSGPQESDDELTIALFEAILRAGVDDQPAWLHLIDGLASSALLKIRKYAEAKILQLVLESIHICTLDLQSIPKQIHDNQLAMRTVLRVIECTTKAPSEQDLFENGAAMVERLKAIADLLAPCGVIDSILSDVHRELVGTCIDHCIHVLLQLSMSRTTAMQPSKNNRVEQVQILRTLCALLNEPLLNLLHPSTNSLIFDTAIQLSDDLPEDLRPCFLKSESQRHDDDPQISFLFGPAPVNDGWIALVTTNTTASPTGLLSQPNTPPARFGQGQPQQVSARLQQRPLPAQRQTNSHQIPPKSFETHVPYPLRRWELLPDQGNNASGNDTAISLTLFGVRKVD